MRFDSTITEWTQLVRAEYLEMPGLHLTPSQVQRLWGIDPMVTGQVLTALVDCQFLRRTRSGAYVRAHA